MATATMQSSSSYPERTKPSADLSSSMKTSSLTSSMQSSSLTSSSLAAPASLLSSSNISGLTDSNRSSNNGGSLRQSGGRSINFPPPLDKQKMLRLPSAGSRFQPPQYNRVNAATNNADADAGSFSANPLLVGRRENLDTLEQLYKNVVAKGRSTMVAVEGKAGTGKSSLVHNAALPNADIFPNALFVSTMYEPTRASTEPYSALVDAILILVRKIRQLETASASTSTSTPTSTAASSNGSSSSYSAFAAAGTTASAANNSNGGSSRHKRSIDKAAQSKQQQPNSLRDFLLQPSIQQDLPLLKKVLPQLWDLAHLNKKGKHKKHAPKYSPVTHCKVEKAIQNIHHRLSKEHDKFKNNIRQQKAGGDPASKSDGADTDAYTTTDESTSNSDETSSSLSLNSDDIVRTASFQRLKSILRRLFADYCCKPSRPVVLHLDNVQYIDHASAELLQSIILDGQCYCEHSDNEAMRRKAKKSMKPIHGLLLVLSYTVDDHSKNKSAIPTNLEDSVEHKYSPLCQTIQLVQPAKIKLDNLNQQQVHDVFIQLIQQPPTNDTREMANVLYKKTNGNPYDLSQFLIYLQEQNHLYMDTFQSLRWSWKSPSYIDSVTAIPSSQVAMELTKATFNKLKCPTKAVLMVASCIGKDIIPVVVIEEFFRNLDKPIAWEDKQEDDSDVINRLFACNGIYALPPEDVVEQLEIAVRYGILVNKNQQHHMNGAAAESSSVARLSTSSSGSSRTSSNLTATATYTWSHEKVQEAAYYCLFEKKRHKKTALPGDDHPEQPQSNIQEPQSNIPEISTADQEAIHVRLGNLLWRMSMAAEAEAESQSSSSTQQSSEWMVYLAASQLNTFAKRRQETTLCYALGMMNLRAAKLSISKSAFYPAVELLQFGISNLPSEERWGINSKYYEVTLELYTTLAETEYYVGHLEHSKEAINQVLAHANRSCYDKYRVQLLLGEIASSGLKRDYGYAQTVYVDILKKYGCDKIKTKVGWFRLLRERQKLRRDFPDKTWRDLATAPTLEVPEDESQSAMALPSETEIALRKGRLLTDLIYSCVSTNNWGLIELCSIYLQRLTFTYGFAVYSLLPVILPAVRLKEKKKFTEIFERTAVAVEASNRISPNSPDHARITLTLHAAIFPLNRPFHDSLDPVINCYRIFLAIGDMEGAFIAAMIYSYCYMSLGLGLTPLESDMSNYHRLSMQFNMAPSLQVVFQVFQQTILNLQGEGYDMKHNPASLIGDIMNEDDVLLQMQGSTQYIPTVRDMCSSRLMLACVFNDYHAMEANLDASIAIPFKDPMIARINYRATYTALACFLLGKSGQANAKGVHDPSMPVISKKKRRMYLQVGKEILRFYEAMVKDGSVNGLPVLLLIRAVKTQDEKAYHKAIVACGRSGLTHLEAIANEQLGRLIMRTTAAEHGGAKAADESVIEDYLTRALERYDDWGATGKVAQMKSEFDFLASSRRSRTTNTLRARTRFDGRTSTMLERVNLEDVIPAVAAN
mmetsp:Transcript_27049/g.76084  ORF Transcript_27049/g.76084 Transcript_27049/m.76084 type:complete len:1493 (+) Transcript_27049:394-4872(+)|eukprot:CAMPEP_0119564718 /NCGR_PEP_ID=MMETSP1352-20130426/27783_1 /TAXON_ID=265584 /ORGANISM="Stauroneis constricta, Strain CCMP1120" /LENGTH=1492 /DNA_ID=CAMNT_0007613495 /DNA_START=311 /DNA_END=4789 /DNA_ORIENTATION=-